MSLTIKLGTGILFLYNTTIHGETHFKIKYFRNLWTLQIIGNHFKVKIIMFLVIMMGEIRRNNTFKINICFTFLHSHEHCLHWRLSEMILNNIIMFLLSPWMKYLSHNKEFKNKYIFGIYEPCLHYR